MIYSMNDFVMANFCLYAYEGPDTLTTSVFRDGLMFGGSIWTFNRSNFIENTSTDTQCYMFTSSSSNNIAVVFRGTENLNDWLNNFANRSYTAWPTDQSGSNVGAGWLKVWNSVKSEVEQRLSAVLPSQNARVFITGHSLGAAIAAVASVDIWRDVLSKRLPQGNVELVTFASPLVGNGVFATYFEDLAKQFGSYRLYRDPNDEIRYANTIMSRGWSDPYVDFKNVYSTRAGAGHYISNYVNLLNPGTVEYTVQAGSNSPSRALAPDDAISTLTIGTAASHSFVVDDTTAPPPIDVSLMVGVKEDGSGGIELPIYKEGGSAPFFTPGGITFQTFDSAVQGLKVTDLQRCKLALTMTCAVDEMCCNIDMTHPVLLDGFQINVNGFPVMTDYTRGATVSLNNPSFMVQVPTPHYNIVGGRMQVTDSTSKEPLIEEIFWGQRTDKEIYISSAYCYTEQYGKSYCYTTLYVQPTGVTTTNGQRVVGGRMQITDSTSSKPLIETTFWGERSATEVSVANNYAFSTQYGYGYSYTSVYLSPAGAAPANQPRVIGGRMQVTDSTSKEPFIETIFWGERSDYEVYASNGYCYTDQYGGDSYCYTTVYMDRPVNTSGTIVTTLEINLISIHCELPQEFGMFGNHDEIYLKTNGSKSWPAASYYSITGGQTAQVNQTFEMNTESPARLELWEVDDLSADDQLYEFFFSNDILAYDPDSNTYTSLQNCKPSYTYRIFGRKVDGENYGYYLNVQVQKKS